MKCISFKSFFPVSLGLLLAGFSGCGESQVGVTITPKNVTVPTQVNFQFTAEISNTQDLNVIWSIDHNTNGSLGKIDSATGIYTTPDVIPTPNTATIRVTSQADSSSTDVTKVTIVSGNTLQFGNAPLTTPNLQVTNYSVPPGLSCMANCTAGTVSSGQHSVMVHHAKHGKFDYTLIYTVWSDNRNGAYDVFFRQITIKALITTPPTAPVVSLSNTIRVNDNLTDSSDPANPSLAVDRSGNVFVAWHADGGAPSYHDIYVNKGKLSPFKDDTIPNITFTIPNLFSDPGGACDKRGPSIVSEGNKLYVAWQDARATLPFCGDYNIRATAGPAPTNPPPSSPPTSYPVLSAGYTGSGSQTEPSIGFYQNELFVAWTGAQIFCNGICFTKGKAPTGSVTSWSTTAPVVVNDDVGLFNDDPPDHFLHPSLVVDSTGGTHNAGNVYVAWQDDRDGNFNIFLAKKEKSKTDFDALTDPNFPGIHNIRINDDSGNAIHQRPSIVVALPEPNAKTKTPNKIYVAWDDTRNDINSNGRRDIITAKSLDGGDSFWTNSGPANLPPGSGPSYDSSIAVDSFGRAYLIWTDERNAGGGTDVFFTIGQ